MISCHRISPSGEDRWVGSHKTMVPTKLWLLGSRLIGLHVLHDLDHPSHHIILCLAMGFIPLEYLHPCRHLSQRWWWWWFRLTIPTHCCPRRRTSGVNHPIQDTSLIRYVSDKMRQKLGKDNAFTEERNINMLKMDHHIPHIMHHDKE
jgi:hypothetical protein